MLEWQLQCGSAESCSNLQPPLNQQPVLDHGDSGASCSQTEHRIWHLGDLTTKCGPSTITYRPSVQIISWD